MVLSIVVEWWCRYWLLIVVCVVYVVPDCGVVLFVSLLFDAV